MTALLAIAAIVSMLIALFAAVVSVSAKANKLGSSID
jgi:ABC-type uncharacterized transport system permease subunit